MMNEKEYEIQTGTGRTDTVSRIETQEMANHIRSKGFYPHSEAYPKVGNYYSYEAFGEGSYVVYDKDFVEDQLNLEDERDR